MNAKQRQYEQIETSMRANIESALKQKPGATFGDILEGLQTGIKKDLLRNANNDSALLMRALLNVLQHFYKDMTIEGSIRE